MNTDESAWSRGGSEAIVAHGVDILRAAGATTTRDTPERPYASLVEAGSPPLQLETDIDIRGESAARTHDVWGLIMSGPALALAAFAFACAQLVGGLVPGELASMIPGAADSPTNHVRIVSLFAVGMAGVGISLAAAAFVRIRSARFAIASSAGGATGPAWAGWLAGAAVVICALIAVQSLLLIILSALAPPGAPG